MELIGWPITSDPVNIPADETGSSFNQLRNTIMTIIGRMIEAVIGWRCSGQDDGGGGEEEEEEEEEGKYFRLAVIISIYGLTSINIMLMVRVSLT